MWIVVPSVRPFYGAMGLPCEAGANLFTRVPVHLTELQMAGIAFGKFGASSVFLNSHLDIPDHNPVINSITQINFPLNDGFNASCF